MGKLTMASQDDCAPIAPRLLDIPREYPLLCSQLQAQSPGLARAPDALVLLRAEVEDLRREVRHALAELAPLREAAVCQSLVGAAAATTGNMESDDGAPPMSEYLPVNGLQIAAKESPSSQNALNASCTISEQVEELRAQVMSLEFGGEDLLRKWTSARCDIEALQSDIGKRFHEELPISDHPAFQTLTAHVEDVRTQVVSLEQSCSSMDAKWTGVEGDIEALRMDLEKRPCIEAVREELAKALLSVSAPTSLGCEASSGGTADAGLQQEASMAATAAAAAEAAAGEARAEVERLLKQGEETSRRAEETSHRVEELRTECESLWIMLVGRDEAVKNEDEDPVPPSAIFVQGRVPMETKQILMQEALSSSVVSSSAGALPPKPPPDDKQAHQGKVPPTKVSAPPLRATPAEDAAALEAVGMMRKSLDQIRGELSRLEVSFADLRSDVADDIVSLKDAIQKQVSWQGFRRDTIEDIASLKEALDEQASASMDLLRDFALLRKEVRSQAGEIAVALREKKSPLSRGDLDSEPLSSRNGSVAGVVSGSLVQLFEGARSATGPKAAEEEVVKADCAGSAGDGEKDDDTQRKTDSMSRRISFSEEPAEVLEVAAIDDTLLDLPLPDSDDSEGCHSPASDSEEQVVKELELAEERKAQLERESERALKDWLGGSRLVTVILRSELDFEEVEDRTAEALREVGVNLKEWELTLQRFVDAADNIWARLPTRVEDICFPALLELKAWQRQRAAHQEQRRHSDVGEEHV